MLAKNPDERVPDCESLIEMVRTAQRGERSMKRSGSIRAKSSGRQQEPGVKRKRREGVMPMLPSGGIILADNTLWSGKVLDPQEDSDHAIVRFNEHARADDRVEQVLLSVRDGVMMARKR